MGTLLWMLPRRDEGVRHPLLQAVLLLALAAAPRVAAAEAVPGAEPPFERGLEKLRLELLAARTGLCALSVAAHPDDEDGATISWMRRVAGIEVHMCLATRGEGGQNESGPELEEALAWKRTQETEAAARILGAKVWYLNLPDFGYSENAQETLEVWNRKVHVQKLEAQLQREADSAKKQGLQQELDRLKNDSPLARLVRIIRIVKPDILFTNHDPKGTDHGHHVATAQLLYEAFDAAADPKNFPEQIEKEGLQAWKASKLYRRLRDFEVEQATLRFEVSQRDPSSGHSPAEIAAWALKQHVSQGMSREVKVGEKEERHFVLEKSNLASDKKEITMRDGFKPLPFAPAHILAPHMPPIPLNTEETIKRLKLMEEILHSKGPTGSPGWAFDEIFSGQGKASWALSYALGSIFEMKADRHGPNQKIDGFNTACDRSVKHIYCALGEALGVRVEASTEDSVMVSGEEVNVTVRFANTGALPVQIDKWNLVSEAGWELGTLALPKDPIEPGKHVEATAKVKASKNAFPNYPFEGCLGSRIETRTPMAVEVSVKAGAEKQEVAYQLPQMPVPLSLAPDFEARFTQDPVLIFDDPDRDEKETLWCRARLVVTNHRRTPWTLYMKLLKDERMQTMETGKFAGAKLDFTSAGQVLTAEIKFSTTVAGLGKGDLLARVQLYSEHEQFSEWAPVARFRRVPLKISGALNVGLVRTYDAATWEALRRLGAQFSNLNVTELTPQDLLEGDLSSLHTIILDLRATQYRPDVLQQRERLRAYMEQGGNVVCMYHKDFDWNPLEEEARGRGFFRGQGGGGTIAPYPLTLSFERVTEETAPVRILLPEHPLLSAPCKIWEKDFVGWVQERGVYFPSKWDGKYEALLSSNDAGAKALDGGLLVAAVGKGSFVYTSYVWYRQFRAGVPGAYRMLANLISYPKIKKEK